MKLCLYHIAPDEMFLLCRNVLKGLGFSIHREEPETGILSALRSPSSPNVVAVMDFRIRREKECVTVSIFSSSFSMKFGNFCHDAGNEEAVVDELLDTIRSRKTTVTYRMPAGMAMDLRDVRAVEGGWQAIA